MKRMAERNNQMGEAPAGEHPLDFAHDLLWMLDMLQHGVALDPLEQARRKRQVLRRGHDIDAGKSKQVDVDVAPDEGTGSADVQVPPAERRLYGVFFGVRNKKVGRWN